MARLVVLAIALRVLFYVALDAAGYFYGTPWDTFTRTQLAWLWARDPYFASGAGYWLPLQFWLAGGLFALLRPWIETSTILVPVLVNQVFFAGSLFATCLAARHLGGVVAARWAAFLAATFPLDILVSYSGVAEPIYTCSILWVGYLLLRFPETPVDRQSRHVLWAGAAVLVAAATHYMGWFLALFAVGGLGALAVRFIARRQASQAAACSLAIAMCVLFPVLWLFSNWRQWGDPWHFIQVAAEYQAGSTGRLPLLERLTIPARTFVTSLSALGVAGLAAAVMVIRVWKDSRSALYLAPAVFVFAMMWVATARAFAAPYEEPRYMVPFGWALIPYVATVVTRAWQTKDGHWRAVVAVVLVALGADSVRGTFSFSNSFGPDVREVAQRAGEWLGTRSGTARVVVEDESFAETGVIPVVAGHPHRFVHVSDAQVRDQAGDPGAFLDARATEWLAIVRDDSFAAAARSQGLRVDRVGGYFLVERPADRD